MHDVMSERFNPTKLVIGISATNSFNLDVSRFLTGPSTDEAVWIITGGIMAAVPGLVGTLRGSKND